MTGKTEDAIFATYPDLKDKVVFCKPTEIEETDRTLFLFPTKF